MQWNYRALFFFVVCAVAQNAVAGQTITELCDLIWKDKPEIVAEIIQICGADADESIEAEDCFMGAADEGNLTLVRFFLSDDRVEPMAPDVIDSAFLKAAARGHVELVEFMIGVAGFLEPGIIEAALLKAVAKGRLNVVKALLRQVKFSRDTIANALETAAGLGHTETVNALLETRVLEPVDFGVARFAAAENGFIRLARQVDQAFGGYLVNNSIPQTIAMLVALLYMQNFVVPSSH